MIEEIAAGMFPGKPPILVVEDDDVDREIIRRTLEKSGIHHPLLHAADGVEALDILNTHFGKHTARPWVILLDINLPRMDGLELLRRLRESEVLRPVIVFILTTSARKEDVVEAYNLNAGGYFLKENLDGLVKMLHCYCRINQLPLGY